MKILIAIGILCGALSSRAAVNTNLAWFIYGIDSFTINDVWQWHMRSNGLAPARAFNYSTNGYSFGRWVTNVLPQIKTLLPPVNSATQAVVFIMAGVNPNASASYAENAEYTAAQFITKHADVVTELKSSNAIVVAFTITGHISDSAFTDVPANAVTYAQWKSTINAALLAGNANFKIDTGGTWPYSSDNYPDGIHPKDAIYQWIGTNTYNALMSDTNVYSPRIVRANRANAGRIYKP